MNEQDKSRNDAAITRIDMKLDELLAKRKVEKAVAVLLTVAIIICLTIAIGTEMATQKMQEDTLNQLMYMQQESDRAVYGAETSQADEVIDSDTNVALSNADRLLVAKICMAETNTYDGYIAVAQTIHDRAALWGQEVYEVATADKQFAAPYNGKASDEALAAVDAVFSGTRAFDSNVTHFYSEKIAPPYWVDGKEYVGTRGGNRFLH